MKICNLKNTIKDVKKEIRNKIPFISNMDDRSILLKNA